MGLLDDAQTESKRLAGLEVEAVRRQADRWAQAQAQFDEVMNEVRAALPDIREKVPPHPIVVVDRRGNYELRGEGWLAGDFLIATDGLVYEGPRHVDGRPIEEPPVHSGRSSFRARDTWRGLGQAGLPLGAEYLTAGPEPIALSEWGNVRIDSAPEVQVVWRASYSDGRYVPLREALVAGLAQLLTDTRP